MSECIICCETENGDYRRITSKCTHIPDVCLECVRRCIENSIEKQCDNFTCLTGGCGKLMNRQDIKNIVTKEVFERYDLLTFRIAIQKITEFRWCKASCGSGQIHTGKNPIVICGGCGAKSCYTHGVIWHEDQTCKEYDESKKQPDFATISYLSQTTKTCPKCTMHIEKNEGCNHMTCKCSYEFCWLCLHKHPGHDPNCEANLGRNNNRRRRNCLRVSNVTNVLPDEVTTITTTTTTTDEPRALEVVTSTEPSVPTIAFIPNESSESNVSIEPKRRKFVRWNRWLKFRIKSIIGKKAKA